MANQISQKIDLLRAQWEKALADERVQAVRWLIEEDEWSMIDAFFRIESSSHGQLPDLFFRMDAPFGKMENYDHALLSEWKQMFAEDEGMLKELAADGINISYDPADVPAEEGMSFFSEVKRFIEALPGFEGRMVLYLSPSEISDKKGLVKYIRNILPALSNRIRIMLVDSEQRKIYTELSDELPRQVRTVSPKLDMEKAMRQMATSGNPTAPNVQFRKCIFEMAAAAGKKDEEGIETLGNKAAAIASKAEWKHLEATAHMVAASHLFGLRKHRKAIQLYEKAASVCLEAAASGDLACSSLLLQCYSLKGACEQMDGERTKAMNSYLLMAKHAQSIDDRLNAMEGWRLAGAAAGKNGRTAESFEYYTQAFENGKALNKEVRMQSGFLLVGEGILEAAAISGQIQRIPALQKEIAVLAGDDWQLKLQRMKESTN